LTASAAIHVRLRVDAVCAIVSPTNWKPKNYDRSFLRRDRTPPRSFPEIPESEYNSAASRSENI
jgi:hypothetical protein